MAKIEQYACDGCGIVKGEANHWWKTRAGGGLRGFHLFTFASLDIEEPIAHYCGQDCVIKALAAFMGEK